MSTYFAADQFRVLVTDIRAGTTSVNLKGSAGGDPGLLFSNMTGGDMDSEPTTLHPGGMLPAVVLRSRRTTAEIVLTKPLEVHDHDRIAQMRPLVGSGRVTIVKTIIDADNNDFGTEFTFTGILKTVSHPEVDAESSDPARWSITVTPDDVFDASPAKKATK